MSAAVEIRRIVSKETIPLRHSVLWPDHPISHVLLAEDATGFHYGAFIPGSDSTPMAVISLFIDPLPESSPSRQAARFRKFACEPRYQGRGIGSALLKHVFEVALTEMKCSVIWCDARVSAAQWYERRGMVRFGAVFYKGDIEYTRMMKDLEVPMA